MRNVRKGFTLIELSLSIAFLAVLSITIVLIITNAISAYHRGLTLNNINSTGMDLINDMTGTIQNAPARSIANLCESEYAASKARDDCEKDEAREFVTVTQRARVVVAGKTIGESVPVFGAFCTGKYSYIWNSGYFFAENTQVEGAKAATLVYNGDGSPKSGFRMLKVEDSRRAVCIAATRGGVNEEVGKGDKYGMDENFSDFNITNYYNTTNEEPVDLLEGSGNMVIYDYNAALPADNGESLFYTASFILGTIQGGINVMAAGDYCATPGGYMSAVENMDYCAINKFNFAAQATGG